MLKFHYERAANNTSCEANGSLLRHKTCRLQRQHLYLNPWTCVDTGCWQMLKFHYERAVKNTSC